MSSYPPPPPPYDPNAWKAQQRMAKMQQQAAAQAQKAQLRMQRAQWKAQRQAMRQRSMIGPVLLIAIGVIALLLQTGKLSWGQAALWYAHWWPAVLILAGVLLVVEWMVARDRIEAGQPAPRVGGGLIFLLIVLALIGTMINASEKHDWWHGDSIHWSNGDWEHFMGDEHESDSELSSSIASGAPLLIRTQRGDVTVTGSSTDGQVHVSVHKKVRAWDDENRNKREDALQPNFSGSGNGLTLNVGHADGSEADVTIETPHETPITVESERGDVSVSQLHAPVTITANRGSVDTSSILGAVKLHVHYDDASLTGKAVTGSVDVDGRAGDMTFTDINGPVTLHGDFFGSTHLEHVSNTVRFQTSRTQFEAARLDGDLDISNGSDFTADQLLGPVTLTTSNRTITLERVQGKLSITNRNGSIHTTSTSPLDAISIHNRNGSVEVGVPRKPGFVLDATAQHGNVSADDFHLDGNDQKAIHATVGSGGVSVTVDTSDGDVTVHEAQEEPLAPAPPPAPKITSEPVPPTPPAKPNAPAKPTVAKPSVPKAQEKPKAPAKDESF